MTRRSVLQFDFVSLTGSLHRLPFFASGHRTIRMSDLYKLDVVFRKMLRIIIGQPSFVELNSPWSDILHHGTGKAVALAQQHGLNAWSEQCLKHHWKFAMHVANLPSNRWVKRVLLWNPTGARTRHDWTSKFVAYTRFHQLGQWLSLAQDPALWMQWSDDVLVSHCLRPKEGCLRTCRRKVKAN